MAITESHHAGQAGHTSDERAAAHEFNVRDAAEALERGHQVRVMSETEQEHANGGEAGGQPRTRKTRGGTHEQHTAAGKKGGSRIRQLIELGYKYEQEHGIGPGQNKRSKLTKRRTEGES